MLGDEIDVDAFLQRPLVAHVASNGPSLRPVWFIWEERLLWWLTAEDSILAGQIRDGDTRLVVVIDSCDLETGEVAKVTITGTAELVDLDRDLAMRKFAKYLGEHPQQWDQRFPLSLADPKMGMVRLTPHRVVSKDMSFHPAPRHVRVAE